jgi:hypothetical protein
VATKPAANIAPETTIAYCKLDVPSIVLCILYGLARFSIYIHDIGSFKCGSLDHFTSYHGFCPQLPPLTTQIRRYLACTFRAHVISVLKSRIQSDSTM